MKRFITDGPEPDGDDPTPAETKALHEEWREDYAAARERDIGPPERRCRPPQEEAREAAKHHQPSKGKEMEI